MGNVVELQVAGIDCGACERRLGAVLGRLDGVGHVSADHTSGVVALRFDAARTAGDALTAAAAAAERIEQAGFTVTSTEPDDQGQEARS